MTVPGRGGASLHVRPTECTVTRPRTVTSTRFLIHEVIPQDLVEPIATTRLCDTSVTKYPSVLCACVCPKGLDRSVLQYLHSADWSRGGCLCGLSELIGPSMQSPAAAFLAISSVNSSFSCSGSVHDRQNPGGEYCYYCTHMWN
jgi:hypothetical protein